MFDGKNVLVVLLAGFLGILAKTTWDRTPANADAAAAGQSPPASGGSSSTSPLAAAAPAARAAETVARVAETAAAPSTAAKPRTGSAKTPTGPSGIPAPSDTTLVPNPGDPIAQIEADFPGAFAPPSTNPNASVPGTSVQVVVATLPNPLATGFAADFDRGVEGVERSAQSARYVLQRFRLPWDKATGSGDGKAGWLLFKRDHKTASVDLLLVIIVTEAPAVGVDEKELSSALGTLQSLALRSSSPAAFKKVPILGPYLSGSAVSLVRQLRFWCGKAQFCAERKLVVVSGSATRRLTQAVVQSLAGTFKEASFKATVLPDELLVANMHRFIVERLGVSDQNVGDLTESSSSYGNDVENGSGDGSALPRPSTAGLKIPSPLGIGILASKGKSATDVPKRFDDAAAQLANIRLELSSTFTTLSRHGVDDVGVVATTTENKLFLAQEFLRSAPNLRLHIYEGSIDLTNSNYRKALEGVMVASSYPLFPATQLWNSDGNRTLVQFPSMAAEGIYNALLVLLAESDDDLKTKLADRLLDYVSPFCSNEARVLSGPSAWVSASISGQLWPLAVYPPVALAQGQPLCAGAIDSYVYTVPQAKSDGIPKPSADLSALTIVGFIVILLLVVGNVIGFLPFAPGGVWRFPLVTFAPSAKNGAPPLPSYKGQAAMVLGLWTLAVTGLAMGKVLGLPASCGFAAGYGTDLSRILVVSTLALLVAAGVAAVAYEDRRSQITALAHVITAVALLCLEIGFPRGDATCASDGFAYFFYVRAMDPGVGLTPTIPLFLVGISLYGVFLLLLHVARRAERIQAEALPWKPVGHTSFKSCSEAMTEFATIATKFRLVVCAGCVGLGAFVLYGTPLHLGSLEGRSFDLACSVCFSLVFTVTLAAAWRAYSMWQHLSDFTRALAMHPAATALQRLPASVAQRFRSPVPGQIGSRQIQAALTLKEHAYGAGTTVAELLLKLAPRWFPYREASSASPPAPGAAAQPKPVSAAVSDTPAQATPAPTDDKAREEIAEDILALKMAEALGLMCDAVRTMLLVATSTGLVGLFGYALYPFQPAATLTGASLVSVGTVAFVALRLLLGIERDPVLSHVSGTKAGEITPSLGLFARLIGYVVVPLGTLVGARLQEPGAVIEMFKNLANALNH